MTESLQSASAMDDGLRSAYLDSMGITCWIPKNHAEESLSFEAEIVKSETISVPPKTLGSVKAEPTSTEAKIQAKKVDKQSLNNTDDEHLAVQATSSTESVIATNNQYLKLVNWQNQVIKEEGNKQLLIICRHQIDQPASSFATVNSPSRFMQDYINSLISFIEPASFDLKIQLAHLSQAGLGGDTINMDEHIDQSKPDLILLLGEETVSQFLGEKSELAPLRGQIVGCEKPQKIIVSYHPFSLIKNPSLKTLALDDLRYLSQYLSLNE